MPSSVPRKYQKSACSRRFWASALFVGAVRCAGKLASMEILSLDHLTSDLVLDLKKIVERAVVCLRPQMVAVSARTSCTVTRTLFPDLRTLPSRTLADP